MKITRVTLVLTAALAPSAAACTSPPAQPATAPSPPAPAASQPATAQPPRAADVLVAAVGDIADCRHNDGAEARRTAELLKTPPDVPILVAGDIAYPNGTKEDFDTCYAPRWGFLKDRIRPAPGNHEYGNDPARTDAAPYFAYFGGSAGPDERGFYSFDLGAWHIVSLNSMAGVKHHGARVKGPSMADQIQWLEHDLNGTNKACILAFWHHPLFSSGHHGQEPGDPGRKVDGLWDTLASHGADVIVNGHDHDFEVFALQTSAGVADAAHGIREFVVGTGGAESRPFETPLKPNREDGVAGDSALGVLLLQLHAGSYEWKFANVDGTTPFASQAPQACHPKESR